ncbi:MULTISPECIES: hypothetical protein [Brevibacillus]|uniref:Uncharacterized protein n=1 Tax=Brevibacillus parabrevis TaxID=54914 RepID=A0A4Y3PKZ5_BREPA|nr:MULTISPECIES: hypothetical protein [Brevibacillus]MDH6349795.1 hypothetical protein [Brevibacillus sp. 1238]RNB94134.1 hypothetical protein EDM60_17195 [Brevibacillus parabrevis]UED67144.1 hypothetical protein HP435_17770 [Brevibacillus sp. HD3.3A]GEB31111.1 hypothetical protein BPA01_06910 [Brevibacillus parabrevis]HBZ80342.1 hypothetical protein [Brevibacillus sp.]
MDENVKRLYDKAGFGSYTGGAGLQAEIKQLVTADPAPRSFESLASLVELLLAHPRTAVFVTEKVLRAFYKPAPSADEIEYFARIYRHFRSIYASVIDGYLGGAHKNVLGQTYETLPIFRTGS